MKLILSSTFLILSSFLFAQITVQGDQLFLKSTDVTDQTKGFDGCWCAPVAFDSSGNVTALEANIYPLPFLKNGNWGLLDKAGAYVQNIEADQPILKTKTGTAHLNGFAIENHQWMLNDSAFISVRDSNNQETVKYWVTDFYKGTFLATKDRKSWGLLNSKMETILPFNYIAADHEEKIFEFNKNGILTLRENRAGSLFGAVDHLGKTVIPFKWKLISYVITDDEHIYVMNEYLKRGYINIKGQTTLPFIYENIPRELSDSNRVTTKDYVYFLDKNLNQIGPKYQSYEREGDVWFYKLNGKWGVRDLNNKDIIPNVYNSIMYGPRLKDDPDFRCYIVVKNGMYGLITTKGEVIVTPGYECLCGLSYYAPSNFYIEFQKGGVSYKFDHAGKLTEKGGKSQGNCFCE